MEELLAGRPHKLCCIVYLSELFSSELSVSVAKGNGPLATQSHNPPTPPTPPKPPIDTPQTPPGPAQAQRRPADGTILPEPPLDTRFNSVTDESEPPGPNCNLHSLSLLFRPAPTPRITASHGLPGQLLVARSQGLRGIFPSGRPA